jgi:hypothetical protein
VKQVARPAALELRLLVIHPSADPAEITREVGLEPLRSWRSGDPRYAPKGTRLEGIWPDTRWSHGFALHKNATLETAVASALDKLKAAERYLAKLRGTGGTAELIVSLSGDAHQGASLNCELLQELADLGVDLGIEVFPKVDG